jgi:tyrosine-protein phosphatase YwqE
MNIMNPLNPKILSAYISCVSFIAFEINLNSDFTLTGKTTNVDLELKDFKALFRTSETLEDIKQKIKGIQPILTKALDMQLENGMNIPIPDSIKKSFKSSSLQTFDNYIYIEGDIDVSEAKKAIEQSVYTFL